MESSWERAQRIYYHYMQFGHTSNFARIMASIDKIIQENEFTLFPDNQCELAGILEPAYDLIKHLEVEATTEDSKNFFEKLHYYHNKRQK